LIDESSAVVPVLAVHSRRSLVTPKVQNIHVECASRLDFRDVLVQQTQTWDHNQMSRELLWAIGDGRSLGFFNDGAAMVTSAPKLNLLISSVWT